MQSTWDPAQYERFRAERDRPFYDLLALVQPKPDPRVIDLGCGTGELTRALHRTLGARDTLGIDNAETMLRESDAFAGDGLRFALTDIAAFAADRANDASFDLVFSNAALQWVPDHEKLLRRLTELLADGGQLAVHVPANYDHPAHVVAAEVAAEEPFRAALGGSRGIAGARPVLSPESYAEGLDRLGYHEQHVRLQVYGHHMNSWEDVVEWVKGSLLTDYRRRLPPDLYPRFLERYRELLGARLGYARPYFYPFKRILLWGQH